MNRPAANKEVTPPATSAASIWGTVFPIPAEPSAGDDFEARVHRAWEHLKAAYFAAEEHDRLREVLAARIEGEMVPGSGERRGQDDGRN